MKRGVGLMEGLKVCGSKPPFPPRRLYPSKIIPLHFLYQYVCYGLAYLIGELIVSDNVAAFSFIVTV